MQDKMVKRHVFCFNDCDNGGESFILKTEYFDKGDGEVYSNQELTLQSYFNSATFSLMSVRLTAAKLRMLANELEIAEREALALARRK